MLAWAATNRMHEMETKTQNKINQELERKNPGLNAVFWSLRSSPAYILDSSFAWDNKFQDTALKNKTEKFYNRESLK